MKTEDAEKPSNLTGIHYVIAGAATGTITRFILQPLDVLKITFQLQTTPKDLKEKAKYTSLFQAVRTIVREEGVPGLWKGHIPAQFLSIIFGAVQFSTYEFVTGFFHDKNPLHYTTRSHIVNIAGGSIAGLTGTIASYPFDVVKTHLIFQGDTKVYTGTIHATRVIYNKKGAQGFFKGLAAACIQTVPMSGLVFCFHGLFSQVWLVFFSPDDTSVNMTTTGSIATGLFAGLCAKTIVYPFDLMKKRLQIQGSLMPKSSEMIVCSSISECFWLTVKSEGMLGLFKGFVPTLMKAGATTSLYFTMYNEICKILQRSLEKS